MIVRYEIYHHGKGNGITMSDENAEEKYRELKNVAKCGWAQLLDDDGKVIKSFHNETVATLISNLELYKGEFK